MAANLSSKLTLDGTQHNDALRTAAKELSKYKREVANTDKQLKQFKNQSRTATGAINTFAQSLKSGNIQGMMIGASGATNALGSSLLKLGGWFGVAMGATELFTEAIHSSQTAEDEFGRIQAQVTTVVDNFFSALTTGDFSSFLNGINSITSSAKEAFNAMDDLFNMAQAFDVKNSRLNNKFQKNLLKIRELKGSNKPEDKKKVQDLVKENKDIINQQAQGAQKLYNQTIIGLQKEIMAGTGMKSSISASAIYNIAENDIDHLKSGRAQFAKEYNDYLSEVDKMSKQAERKKGRYFMGKTGVNYQNDINDLQKKYGKSIAANYILEKKSDEELQNFYGTLKQGLGYESIAIANSAKMLKYTKETTDVKQTKTSKPKKTNKPEEEELGIIQKINAEIKRLNEEKEKATSISDIQRINGELEKLEWKLDAIKKGIDPDKMYKSLDKFDIPSTILQQNIDFDKIELPKIEVPNIADTYKLIVDKIYGAADAADMGMIGAEQANKFIEEFNAQLEALGLKPIEVHIKTNAEEKLSEISDVIDSLGDSFSSLGKSLEIPALDIAGVIGQAIANVLLSYSQAMTKPKDPISWITFGLAGLAQVAGIISQIHSLSGYANGGIVGGNRTMGDHTLIRANAGEMMLNTRQQARLFSMLDGGTHGTEVNPSQVVFTIKGNVLQGVLDNYNNKMKKVR